MKGRGVLCACPELTALARQVPAKWEAMAYPSKRSLSSWLLNLLDRHK
jgi:hypothetical protein